MNCPNSLEEIIRDLDEAAELVEHNIEWMKDSQDIDDCLVLS